VIAEFPLSIAVAPDRVGFAAMDTTGDDRSGRGTLTALEMPALGFQKH